ncbi:MAG: ANTAR domain-containing response regulator [Ignavibacteriales bacterium]
METGSLLIALSSENQLIKMKNFIVETGYGLIQTANDSTDSLRKARQLKPDIVIIDFELSQYVGYETAKVIAEDGISSTILILNEAQYALLGNEKDNVDLTFLLKPISKSILSNTIEIIMKNRRKIKQLEKQISQLKDSLDARKVIEKAKGLLMGNQGLSEVEAYRKMQKESMDTGVTMKDLAEKIIKEIVGKG